MTNAVQTTVGVARVQRTRETVTAVLMAGWDQSVRPSVLSGNTDQTVERIAVVTVEET